MKKQEYTIEDASVGLALVDMIPVLLFGAGAILVSMMFSSWMFRVGILCCVWAGFSKALWKLILALKKKNIFVLNKLFRPFMIGGFLLTIISVITRYNVIPWTAVGSKLIGIPQVFFFLAGVVGMVLMFVFAMKLDPSDVKANWKEQITNSVAQACFFIGILMIYLG